MSKHKLYRSRAFATAPAFSYLPDTDRYLLAPEKPSHKFNIIGVGMNGQEHIRVSMLEGRADINGVYDPNPGSVELAKRNYAHFNPQGALKTYDTLESACNDPAVDGLIIATPNYTHIDVAKTAIKSGKPILLEKPMATTLQDAYAITQLAKSYSALFQVGLQYRYKPIYVEAAHEAFDRRSLGDVKTITILEHRLPFLDKVNQWNKFSKFSGGTLVEKCCHYFDLFNYFAQSKPTAVFATGSQAVNYKSFEYAGEKSDILDNAFVNVVYENGVRANFNLCMFVPMTYEELVICGDEGRLKAYENEDYLNIQRPSSYLEVLCEPDRPSRISHPSYPKFIEQTGHHGGSFLEHAAFIDGIEGKKTQAATVVEGFWSVVIGIAAEQSVKRGALVNVDELLAEAGIDKNTI
jgi:predicted dehydrogenase